jgi:phosphatidylserine decarboxylase
MLGWMFPPPTRGVLVRQVAGFLARRAVCRVKEGDSLRKGDRYGIIKFGSRVDLYLPRIADIVVKSGDYVRAGETVLALIGP